MDYYAFEYSVLMRLQEIFAIKDINMVQDVFHAKRPMRDEFGNLHDTTIAKIVGKDTIRLNFNNDFYIKISKDSLIKAYNEKCEIEDVVRRLRKYIESEWLRRIYK